MATNESELAALRKQLAAVKRERDEANRKFDARQRLSWELHAQLAVTTKAMEDALRHARLVRDHAASPDAGVAAAHIVEGIEKVNTRALAAIRGTPATTGAPVKVDGRTTAARARDHECPTCSAKPGYWCTRPSGSRTSHSRREKLVRREHPSRAIRGAPATTGVPLTLASGNDTPWSVREILKRLADAADHLLGEHSCDAIGHEGVRYAVDAARALLAAPPPPEALVHGEPERERDVRLDLMPRDGHPYSWNGTSWVRQKDEG